MALSPGSQHGEGPGSGRGMIGPFGNWGIGAIEVQSPGEAVPGDQMRDPRQSSGGEKSSMKVDERKEKTEHTLTLRVSQKGQADGQEENNTNSVLSRIPFYSISC